MSNNWIVYKHTSPNNKIYIGITCKEPARRWCNGIGYKYNSHFYNSIQKYGWDNFKHEILFNELSKDEACIKETELIKLYRSNQFKYGFNQSTGGQGGRHGVPFTEDEKQRRSKPIICITTEKEYKSIKAAADDLQIGANNICQCLKGTAISIHGYQFKYLHENNKNIRDRYIPHNAKPVIEIDSSKEFESVIKASEYYGIHKSLITSVCLGKTAQTHGHKFRYKDSAYLYKPRKCHGKLKVINITTGEVFTSILSAAKTYSLSDKMISACCKGLINNVGGYKWEYTI